MGELDLSTIQLTHNPITNNMKIKAQLCIACEIMKVTFKAQI